jgi:hypothetical protein
MPCNYGFAKTARVLFLKCVVFVFKKRYIMPVYSGITILEYTGNIPIYPKINSRTEDVTGSTT